MIRNRINDLLDTHFSVRSRLLTIVLLLVLSLIFISTLAVTALTRQIEATESLRLASRAQYYQQDADMMHDGVRADVYAAVIAVDSKSDANYRQAAIALAKDSQRFRDDLTSLASIPVGKELVESLATIRPLLEHFISSANEIVDHAVEDASGTRARLSNFDTTFEQVKVALEKQTNIIASFIDRTDQTVETAGEAARRRILFSATVFCGIATLFTWFLALSISGMADNLRDSIGRLRTNAERDAFGARLVEALEMSDTESQTQHVVSRAMLAIADDLPMELLLADSSNAQVARATQHPIAGAPGCTVESPFSCVAVRRGNPVQFDDSTALNACPRLQNRPYGPVSAVCVPLSFMGRSLGVLHSTGPVGKLPSAETIRQLTTLGIHAGARLGTVRAIERTQRQASTDSLTGLANRRTLEDVAHTLLGTGVDFSLVMIDLDHFKRLNDTFGHEAGDSALRIFSEVVRNVFRADDHPARWGGEEFAAIIPGLLAQDAVKVVDRLRAALAEALLANGSHPFTASFGVADTTMTRTLEQLVRIADDALYLSKDGGRDRATVGDPQRVTPHVPRRPSEHAASIDLTSISKLA